jgi:hypothetical protein
MAENERHVVARREFRTEDGDLTLQILKGLDSSTSFSYEFLDKNGEVTASLESYGVDSLQALLFCITAAGDYLARYAPTASFADLGVTAVLTTDLTTTDVWRAQVSMPAILPPDSDGDLRE